MADQHEGSDKSMLEKIKDQFKSSSKDKDDDDSPKNTKSSSEGKCESVEFYAKPTGYGSHPTYAAATKGGLKDQEPVLITDEGQAKHPSAQFQSVKGNPGGIPATGFGGTSQGGDFYERNLGETEAHKSHVPAKQRVYGYGNNA
ncbi:hypothetical protein AaE_008731 [Aphanomyces astaci]|uniref:Uncharacterized protein n=1 Tax=Aphanomyces astaci TaxID=112090 RepID=A0A6A5AAD2_APHAT|nr:hypothetical protein AaE_008731 [Aphanomyces astaci]